MSESEPDLRWLVAVLVDLARRFLGHAVKRYPDLAAKRVCPRCGHRG